MVTNSAFAAVVAAGGGVLTAVDRSLAELLTRQSALHSAQDRDRLALTVALLSRQRRRGNSCIEISAWAGRAFPGGDGEQPLPNLPDLPGWQELLARTTVVGKGERPTPLVYRPDGRLYFYRYWQAEKRLAEGLKKRLHRIAVEAAVAPGDAFAPEDATALANPDFVRLFRHLFPPSEDAVDWQGVAAAMALVQPTTLISGGPGTGKTTTVSRILALVLNLRPTWRILLAAPTGKAAARLGESIAEQTADLNLDPEVLSRFPSRASTVHRLLGYQPYNDRFRHDAARPLSCDLLVIDEASMVDLLMMDAVLSALPSSAHLLMLGDRDQLASVETGFVFGDLCAASGRGLSPNFAEFYHRLSGAPLPPSEVNDQREKNSFGDLAVELQKNYRFQHQPGIGRLAAAIRQQELHQVFDLLDNPAFDDIGRRSPPVADPRQAIEPLWPLLEAYSQAADASEALERLGTFRILCAVRQGTWGTAHLNRLVESAFVSRDEGSTLGTDPWYQGRPVLITSNDYQLRLFNGDLGVCWPEEGRLFAWFPAATGGLRKISLARLPPHETAWAMTVHKSQGSEVDQVLLVLPDSDRQVLNRELLYTGVTRARRRVILLTTTEILQTALLRRGSRTSGLATALADGTLSAWEPMQQAVEETAEKKVEQPPKKQLEEVQSPGNNTQDELSKKPSEGTQLTLF